MGVQTRTITEVLDDFDGKSLPEGTQPLEVTYNKSTYSLYMSAANTQKFIDFLEGKSTLAGKSAAATTATRTRRTPEQIAEDNAQKEAKAKQRAEIAAFGKKNKTPIPTRAAISQDVLKAFYAANPDATQEFFPLK